MKAVIFNSGIGSRMKDLTKNNPKAMIKLYNGETIFERQIRILSKLGIKDFIVTTGKFEDQFVSVANKYEDLQFKFVKNPEYNETNYIVSMNYINKYLDSDLILLHGDLVFNEELPQKLIDDPHDSVCLYNQNIKLLHKDFKGRIVDNYLREVSINIFDNDCYAFQPMYKLSYNTISKWKSKVEEYVNNGIVNVYAENALNELLSNLDIYSLSYKDDYIDEIDTEEDYYRVNRLIRDFEYKDQIIYSNDNLYNNLKNSLKDEDFKKIFVVCTNSKKEIIDKYLKDLNYEYELFNEFNPNPKYEDIIKGFNKFESTSCDILISIGGGSSIDVAKCIKNILNKDIAHVAIPTTAGTGSESTNFAVMYKDNIKQSIQDKKLLPNKVILDYNLLFSMNDYVKKSALLDCLCQGIESYLSVKSNCISKSYAIDCINLVLENYKDYLNNNNKTSYFNMQKASNYSGRAINISKTTAPHGLSYKLTSKYNISHGHAVGICLLHTLIYTNNLINSTNEYNNVEKSLMDIAKLFKCNNINELIKKYRELLTFLKLPSFNINLDDLDELVSSVNIERLNNYPIKLSLKDIAEIYKSMIN